jgi:histidinol dehydrogenase
MRIVEWKALKGQQKNAVLQRPAALLDEKILERTRAILKEVRQKGDVALKEYTVRFDGIKLSELRVSKQEMKAAWDELCLEDRSCIEIAKANIEMFHKAQTPKPLRVETMSGVVCERVARPLQTVGLYVPGGSAPLLSTLLMLAVPASIAGVKKRVVMTPPGQDGRVNLHVLATAYLCGIEDLFMVGGAQAIAALAYGSESVPKCDKIFGPGNAYVAMAKSLVAMEAGGPAIDLPAGPSEVMVLADDKARVRFVVADLLAQAEHDTMAQTICVCRSMDFAQQVLTEIEWQLADLPRRDIAGSALENGSLIIAETTEDMINIANDYAPEHLIIQTITADDMAGKIINAGSIFIGEWSPESVGDYASGTNHTLPTFGAARSYSGLSVESFIKYITLQKLTREGLQLLGPCVEALAEIEGLEAHKRSVSIRLLAGEKS